MSEESVGGTDRLGVFNWDTTDLWPDEHHLSIRACTAADHAGDCRPVWLAADHPGVVV